MGYQAVYRLSFVDFFFFLAIALGSKFHVVRQRNWRHPVTIEMPASM